MGERDSVNPDQNPEGGDQSKGREQLSYETYQRTVAEIQAVKAKNKELLDKLNNYTVKEKQIEEQKLAEKGEYQKILELRETEIKREREENERLRQELTGRDEDFNDVIRVNSFISKLPGRINPTYLIPFHDEIRKEIPINPETRRVDESALNLYVNKFLKDHGRLVEVRDGKVLPSTSGTKSVGKLTREQWLKLPLKEKKERMAEVEM